MTTIEHIVDALEEKTLPRGLKSRILARIREAAQRGARVRTWVFGILATLSAALFGTAALYALGGASSSGFAAYASLIVTDSGAVAANWKTFLLSLIESAPLFDITIALAGILLFLSFVRAFAYYLPLARRALWI